MTTIQQAIDSILSAVPGAPFPGTVDTVKLGDPSQPLRHIAVTFLPSLEVIERAAALGANLLITHEPTFYNHLDETGWLAANPVYAAKRARAEATGLVIWRFHDTLHALQPDPVDVGLAHELGWSAQALPGRQDLYRLPAATTLGELARIVKAQLGLSSLRVVGDLNQPCQTVGLVAGMPGVRKQLGVLAEADVIVAGEIAEWETSEFARDAAHLGLKQGLILTGHAPSEEPGLRWVTRWLQARFPSVPVTFVPTTSAFQQI